MIYAPDTIEMNYYPIAYVESYSGSESSAEKPKPNSPVVPMSDSNIVPSGGGVVMQNGEMRSPNFAMGTSGWVIRADGYAEFSNVTVRGTINAASGTIGGFEIGADYIRDTGNSFGLSSTSTGADDVRFWAGDTYVNRATADFRVTESGAMTATLGTIGGWNITSTVLRSGATDAASNVLIDSAGTLLRLGPTAGNYIILDGANLRIRSSNYVSGVTGFTVEPTLIEAENLIARGTMRGVTFKYDVISAVGGQLMVTNSDALASDMTALDAATLTVRGDSTFAVDDILIIRAVTNSGIQEEWFRVTNIASAPTYTVTRDLAGAYGANSNPTWKAGTAVAKQGKSDGSAVYSGGWLRLIGEGTNSPYYSVYARDGLAYNSYSEVIRLGNLNGIGGFGSETYGIFIGNSSTGNYLQYDTVSGNLIVNDSILSNQDVYGDGSDGDVTISSNTSLSSDMFYNNLTVNSGFTLNPSGFRIFVKNLLTVQITGAVARNGNNGTAGTNGTTTVGGPGSAGSGGGALADGSVKGALAGQDGVAGKTGVNCVGNSSSNGQAGITGSNGVNVAKSLVASDGVAGSNGGAGGSAGAGNAGATGSGGGAGTRTGTVYNKVRNLTAAYLLYDVFPAGDNLKAAPSNGGAASAGSGGVQTTNSPGNQAASGSTGGSGGAGSNGGIVWIAARKIVNAGTISANGGNGANAGTTFASATSVTDGTAGAGGSGGSAGGAAGNGGVVVYIYSSLTNTGTIQAIAGSVGNGAAAGTPSSNGITGNAGVAGANGPAGNAGVVIPIRV